MNISNFKDLEKLVKLLRKHGIEAVKIDGIELHLGPSPLTAPTKRPVAAYQAPQLTPTDGVSIPQPDIETEELTEEQLLFYSAVPHDVPNEG